MCVRGCPSSDVANFATNIPTECRSNLLPGVTATSKPASASLAVATGAAKMNQNPVGLSVVVVVTAIVKVYAL